MTTKAPVGPPIWTRLPPRNEIRKPGDGRGHEARLGRHARGDREGDRERDGDDPDDDPGLEVGEELPPRVTGQRGEGFRQPRPGHVWILSGPFLEHADERDALGRARDARENVALLRSRAAIPRA